MGIGMEGEVVKELMEVIAAVEFVEVALEGPSHGSAGSDGPEHIFLAAPSLLLLFFRLGTVSIGVSSGVTGLSLAFFLALVVVRTGCSVI